MKKRLLIFFTLAVLTGCSKEIDPAKVREALGSLDGDNKAQLEIALSDIQAGKFKDAEPPLRQIAFKAKLNKDQIAVLKDTMKKVQARAGD